MHHRHVQKLAIKFKIILFSLKIIIFVKNIQFVSLIVTMFQQNIKNLNIRYSVNELRFINRN